MSEGERSRKVRKTGSPKVRKKPEVGMSNAEVESAANQNHSAINTSHSALKELQTANSKLPTELPPGFILIDQPVG